MQDLTKGRLGIIPWGGSGWMGGEIAVRGLLGILDRRFLPGLEVVLFRRKFPRWTLLPFLNDLSRGLFGKDLSLGLLADRRGLDCLVGHLLHLNLPRTPTIAWFSDFQHKHLPRMFHPIARLRRDVGFFLFAKRSTLIVVFGETVREDFVRFLPRFSHKVRIFPPVFITPPGLRTLDASGVVTKYGLPERFMFFPGQFWKHKNHERVFEAVKILSDQNVRVNLVCTGELRDSRDPKYVRRLLEDLEASPVRKQIFILGQISYLDVMALMRKCVCVLNPSLFEGFALTVQEARFMGKPILVSDIAAHREHEAPLAVYVDPLDARALAAKMEKMWSRTPEVEPPLESVEAESTRLAAAAKRFAEILEEAKALKRT